MITTIITTTATTIMTDPAPLLRLLAWMSPAFPTGGFAYSHGLEWAIESGDVRDPPTLTAWLRDVLRHGAGRSDAILVRLSHAAWNDPAQLADLAELAAAAAPARERQEETLNQGRAFALAAAAWGAPPATDAAYPVAVGSAAGAQGIAIEDLVLAYLHIVASNLTSAAVRLIPLGQTAGLRVLAALEADIIAVAHDTRLAGTDDIGGCAFRSDLAAMRHETQYTRLFRS